MEDPEKESSGVSVSSRSDTWSEVHSDIETRKLEESTQGGGSSKNVIPFSLKILKGKLESSPKREKSEPRSKEKPK